jgi:aspartate carbamoyltransferase regulatory subunit
MATEVKAGEKFKCPNVNCMEEQDDIIDDYVIPQRVGHESEVSERCHKCNRKFTVGRNADGTFYVV